MAINKDDVLEALGIEQTGTWFGPAAAAFGIGLVVGAAAALLLAPKSGAELRDDISSKMSRVRNRMQDEMQNMQNPPRSTV
jgi:hypothetical protein